MWVLGAPTSCVGLIRHLVLDIPKLGNSGVFVTISTLGDIYIYTPQNGDSDKDQGLPAPIWELMGVYFILDVCQKRHSPDGEIKTDLLH